MSLSREEENFIKITKIVLEIIPKYLRKLFIEKWNQKYPNNTWKSDTGSGNFLFNEIPNAAKGGKNGVYAKNMQSGNESIWDTTTLVYSMLYSQLNLIPTCRPDSQRSVPLLISEEIDILRKIRNEFFAHASTMKCSFLTFLDIILKVYTVAKNIFGIDAEHEIEDIVKSQITTEAAGLLKCQFHVEKNRIHEIEKMLKALTQQAATVQRKDKLPPYTKKDINDLKTSYKKRYQKHQIHIVDENGRIKLEEVDIDKFAVTLKICKKEHTTGNFRDEARNYLESLGSMTDDDIELSQLFDTKERVVFIRAVAGMGKTTLSKQLITSWSRDEIYNDARVCILLECREINVFRGTRGSHLQTYEIFEEFVKTKFPFDLNNGKDVLFVIDGFDELLGTSTDNCVLKQLLNRNIYPDCKIIVTGRPHVECTLKAYGEVGGLQRVEIQGLGDEQIEEYISKFPLPKGVTIDLNSVKDSSNDFLPLLRTPQFLNSFICIRCLLKSEGIHSKAELYCWTIYLLLKQHADRNSQSETKTIPDIFKEYSKDLSILGEICHKLLGENKIIIPKEDLDALLERGSEFIGSLFLDVSDNFEEKLQFKHLSLMEFLSAFHISSSENPLEMISDNLKNGFLEVVIFVCQLISGWSSKRIISEMLKVNAGKLKQININNFCHDVVKALYGCKFDDRTKFLNSLDIIVSCLNDDAADKAIFLSTVQLLSTESVQTKYTNVNEQFKGIALSVEQSKKLHTIYKHMVDNLKCDEGEVLTSFQHIHVNLFRINHLNLIDCVKYFGYVMQIVLVEMKLNVNDVRREIESIGYGKCNSVRMSRCELEDTEIESQTYGSNLDWVVIERCKLKDINCLLNAFQWAASSTSASGKLFALFYLKIAHEWWSALVTAIEEGMSNGNMKLQWLHIFNCTPQMEQQLQRKILKCGVELGIDGKRVKLEDLTAPPFGASASAPGSFPSHG